MTIKGLCHSCHSSNVEILIHPLTGKPNCKLCLIEKSDTPTIDKATTL